MYLTMFFLIQLIVVSNIQAEDTLSTDPSEGFNYLIDDIRSAYRCTDEQIDVAPYVRELKNAPLDNKTAERLRVELTTAREFAQNSMNDYKNPNQSVDDWRNANCFEIVNGDKLLRMRKVFDRSRVLKIIDEIREFYPKDTP